MRTPDILTNLVDDGIIDEVLRPLMSGKEAQIYLVSSGGEQRVAKIYKDAQQRSFQNRADYTEGRKVRNSRDQRAMNNRSRHGRAQNESAWKSAEVNMIYRLRDAGVRVPTPYHFIDGVLIMELVTDADGEPAARLGDLSFEPEQASQIFQQVMGEVVRMLCAGVVHGDLSDFNVLLGADGPVIIDFPQAVDASSNQNAKKLLLRDVDNLHRFHAKFAPLVQPLPYAQEMWDLYQRMALTPETRLTGKFRVSKKVVNTDDVLSLIADADHEERRRREGLARALRPGTREAVPAARRVEGRAGAAPPPHGDRAPGPGRGQSRGHGQSEQRRPVRSTVPAFTPRDRPPERPEQAERAAGRHAERSASDAAKGQRAPQVQQRQRDARSNQQRDGRSVDGGGARGSQGHRDFTPARGPGDARANRALDGRNVEGGGARGSQGHRDFTPARGPGDARANRAFDGRKAQESRPVTPARGERGQGAARVEGGERSGASAQEPRGAAPSGRKDGRRFSKND